MQRFRDGDNPSGANQAQIYLEASQIVGQEGDAEAARRLLRAAIQGDPSCAEAWRRLAWLVPEEERKAYLRRAVALAPGDRQTEAELARLEQAPAGKKPLLLADTQAQTQQPIAKHPDRREPKPPPSPARHAPRPRPRDQAQARRAGRRWPLLVLLPLGVAVAAVLAVLLWGPVPPVSSLARSLRVATPTPTALPMPTLTPKQIVAQFLPQFEAALAQANWQRAFEITDIMASVDPDNEEIRPWRARALLQYGQSLVRDGQPAEALSQFEQAVALAPNDLDANRWQQATRLYLAGQQALAAGDLTTATDALTQVRDQIPDYPGTVTLLAQAYRQRGIAQQEAKKHTEARADLEAALALQPGDAEAQTHLDQVMIELFPPKRIEVNISKQRFYAWEGDNLIYEFPTSTGLPGRDTATGHYHVLDKIPMAYSSIWRLKMPLWLGIYYVGRVENGIHALPIRPDGTVMWGGFLGQKASYGCIILSNEAAQLIYDWAEVGTPVDIHY